MDPAGGKWGSKIKGVYGAEVVAFESGRREH